MKELKRIDFEKGIFEANGKKYFIESQMSIERFCEFQIYEKEAGLGMPFKKIYENLQTVYQDLNATKFADASVRLNDLMHGVAKLDEKEPAALKICALFMNTEDEDRSVITNDMIVKKIEDWKKEYDMRDFFWFALDTVNGFMEIYNRDFRNTSETKQSESSSKS